MDMWDDADRHERPKYIYQVRGADEQSPCVAVVLSGTFGSEQRNAARIAAHAWIDRIFDQIDCAYIQSKGGTDAS